MRRLFISVLVSLGLVGSVAFNPVTGDGAGAVITSFLDDSTADFDAGVNENVAIEEDGALKLGPGSSNFNGTTLPAGWTFSGSGSASVANGSLTVDGGVARSSQQMLPGQTLTTQVTFGTNRNQTIGLLYTNASNGSEGNLASIGTGPSNPADTYVYVGTSQYLISGMNLTSQTASLRIVWGAFHVSFWKLDATAGWVQIIDVPTIALSTVQRAQVMAKDAILGHSNLTVNYANTQLSAIPTEDFDAPSWFLMNQSSSPIPSETYSNGSLTTVNKHGLSPVGVGPNTSADVVATLPTGIVTQVGLSRGVVSSGTSWIGFYGNSGTSLNAVVRLGSTYILNQPLPNGIRGTEHHFRIEWYPTTVVLSIPSIPGFTPIVVNAQLKDVMTPMVRSNTIDSFYVRSHAGSENHSGNFTSRVFDAGSLQDWTNLTWQENVTANTDVQMQVRTGNTATPDGTWSGWQQVNNSGDALSLPKGQYAQYKVGMTSTSTFERPSVDWVQMHPVAPALDLGDTTSVDFAKGDMYDADVAYIGDGAISAFTGFQWDPNATTVDPSWTATTPAGLTMNNGAMHVNGTDARQVTKGFWSSPNGQLLTFGATFNGNAPQSLGVRESRPAPGTQAASAFFTYFPASQTLRITATPSAAGAPALINDYPMNLSGQAHTFAVNWSGSGWIGFDIDGSRLLPHAGNDSVYVGMPSSQFVPFVSDPGGDTDALIISGEYFSSVPATSSYLSRVIGDGVTEYQGAVNWDADVPGGTAMTVEVRSGDSFDVDGSWTGWTTLNDGDPLPVGAHFVQYRLAMSGTPPTAFPLLREITFSIVE
jgi:hypothetical protein